MTKRPILHLSDVDVHALLDVRVVAQLFESALLASVAGRSTASNPDMLELLAAQVGTRYVMKAVTLNDRGISGFRITSLLEGSESSPLPTRFVMLHDLLTGRFLALIDEDWSYALRMGTGAVVVTKYLARPDARVVTVVGHRPYAEGVVIALRELLPHLKIRLAGASLPELERFIVDKGFSDFVVPYPDLEEALHDADVVMVTPRRMEGEEPVNAQLFAPGTLVCAVGSGPDIDPSVHRRASRIIIDDWKQAARKDLELARLANQLHANGTHAYHLVSVLNGKCQRMTADEIVFVRTYGLFEQDVAICHWLYEEALMHNVGTRLN